MGEGSVVRKRKRLVRMRSLSECMRMRGDRR